MSWVKLERRLSGADKKLEDRVSVSAEDITIRISGPTLDVVGWREGMRVGVHVGTGDHAGMLRLDHDGKGWKLTTNALKGAESRTGRIRITGANFHRSRIEGVPQKLAATRVTMNAVDGGLEFELPWHKTSEQSERRAENPSGAQEPIAARTAGEQSTKATLVPEGEAPDTEDTPAEEELTALDLTALEMGDMEEAPAEPIGRRPTPQMMKHRPQQKPKSQLNAKAETVAEALARGVQIKKIPPVFSTDADKGGIPVGSKWADAPKVRGAIR